MQVSSAGAIITYTFDDTNVPPGYGTPVTAINFTGDLADCFDIRTGAVNGSVDLNDYPTIKSISSVTLNGLDVTITLASALTTADNVFFYFNPEKATVTQQSGLPITAISFFDLLDVSGIVSPWTNEAQFQSNFVYVAYPDMDTGMAISSGSNDFVTILINGSPRTVLTTSIAPAPVGGHQSIRLQVSGGPILPGQTYSVSYSNTSNRISAATHGVAPSFTLTGTVSA